MSDIITDKKISLKKTLNLIKAHQLRNDFWQLSFDSILCEFTQVWVTFIGSSRNFTEILVKLSKANILKCFFFHVSLSLHTTKQEKTQKTLRSMKKSTISELFLDELTWNQACSKLSSSSFLLSSKTLSESYSDFS